MFGEEVRTVNVVDHAQFHSVEPSLRITQGVIGNFFLAAASCWYEFSPQWENGFAAGGCSFCFQLFYFNFQYELLIRGRVHPIPPVRHRATFTTVPFIDTVTTGTFMRSCHT